jgi:endonuclease-3
MVIDDQYSVCGIRFTFYHYRYPRQKVIKAMLDRTSIKKVLELLKAEYSETTTALNFGTPFQLLISTMLAAQSTDKRVNIVTKELFKEYPDAKSILSLSISELENHIKTVGLYKSKAKNVLATCQLLVNKYDGEIPLTREELVELPGVGRKTANVVLSIVTDFKAIAVDTHVFRVSNRIGLAASDDVRKTEDDLMKNIPQKDWSDAHHWLIWHGRKVCQARNPSCKNCILNHYCEYNKQN